MSVDFEPQLTRRVALAGGVGLSLAARARAAAPPAARLTVFAAASLKESLIDVGALFARRSGRPPPVFSFAASSTLARQIEQGAPADLYISADEAWMRYLVERRLVRAPVSLLSNRLALIAPRTSPVRLTIAPGFPIAAALGRGGRLAMADPASVPAGRYGQAALTALGVWDSVKDRTALAENVRAALAFVARGEAPLGITYDTDVRAEASVRIVGLFPEGSHPKIIYPAAAVAASRHPGAATFLAFLRGREARAAFERYGFKALT